MENKSNKSNVPLSYENLSIGDVVGVRTAPNEPENLYMISQIVGPDGPEEPSDLDSLYNQEGVWGVHFDTSLLIDAVRGEIQHLDFEQLPGPDQVASRSNIRFTR